MTDKSTEAAKAVDAMHKTTGTPEEKLAQVTPEELHAVQNERQQADTGHEQLIEGGHSNNAVIEPLTSNGAPLLPADASGERLRGMGITIAGVMLAGVAWAVWRKSGNWLLPALAQIKGGLGTSGQRNRGVPKHLQKR